MHRIINRRLVVLAAMAAPWFCSAQESTEYQACDAKATTQYGINRCASEEAARVDAELNRVYRTLVAKRKDDAAAVEKLKKFERAWIAYRDACFGAAYPAANKQQYGSIYPMEVDLLGAKLTRQQIGVLQDLMSRQLDDSQTEPESGGSGATKAAVPK
jgi:uncharacterized protein YecT (DUF1311 family)